GGVFILAAATCALVSFGVLPLHSVVSQPLSPEEPSAAAREVATDDLVGYGEIEVSFKSDYSTIRIRKQRNTRTLSFIRDNGEEVIESIVNLDRPHDLIVPYTRY